MYGGGICKILYGQSAMAVLQMGRREMDIHKATAPFWLALRAHLHPFSQKRDKQGYGLPLLKNPQSEAVEVNSHQSVMEILVSNSLMKTEIALDCWKDPVVD